MNLALTADSRFAVAMQHEHTLHLLVDGLHCPSCVAAIESALKKHPHVIYARLNLSTRRLEVRWHGTASDGEGFIAQINRMGYRAVAFDPATLETTDAQHEKLLLRCMAVAGFASGNLMLFSVPLWASDAATMGQATQALFRWIQALIAMPAILYCGLPFYRSAWGALKEWRTNMDVPISVAVILATLMSLFETVTHGAHAYFDSAVMLLFFLLIGRYLEARARGRARSAAGDLLQMMAGSATVLHDDQTQQTLPIGELREGMVLLVAAGEKFAADGVVIRGQTDIDTSLITGETLPRPAAEGGSVFAGMLNLTAPVCIRITKVGERSLIAEIVRLMEHAEQGQARYVTLADRIARWYTPAVHALALATFIGWIAFGHAVWQDALLTAATVLIITCPCALGLAVPVVQVLASGTLMRRGILLKSGSALERLADITQVVFDKTGTLTLGKPELLNKGSYPISHVQLAASLAAHSKHPLSQAISRYYQGALLRMDVIEVPGCGLEATHEGVVLRLGKRSWAAPYASDTDDVLELWLARDGAPLQRFTFGDALRSDAANVLANLAAQQLPSILLSGDREAPVAALAAALGMARYEAALSPVEKCERIAAMKAHGARVLMVGDGLNDAPSLASATVSMSPATAMDITQNSADIVFQGEALSPVLTALHVARRAQLLVKQNFALALGYNIIAVPMAVAGYVTPLIAAIAMSASSLVVIVNAMRLSRMREVR